ncbi:unnamed protein product [Prunus brigantina]
MALSTQRDSTFLPSSHQSAPQPNHDVFLSFRGEDTRLSFVSHLYHELQLRGIKTFKDDPKLERGTAISSGFFNAIEESRVAIVVLSPNYASSSWCLDELTKILQCMKSKGTILPVFYNVDPSHVRKQSGSFADAFAEHEKRFREGIDKVKRWRDALTEGFVNYARGLPIALKLLGCLVYKRDQDEWKSELDKLRKIPKSEIFEFLKLSYDGLDEMNKNIFLDVAFFHKWKGKEEVIEILDSCGLCGRIGINALVQKSLLTISNRNVEMHDLIQEMTLEIVRRECPEEPGRRSRLCNHDDISHVFINNTATDKIKGIRLHMETLEKAYWNCEAFSKMLNLKFLEFDNVMISSGPKILPNSLRSIKWSQYPSEFLPLGFQPNFLTALEMSTSKLVRLWDGRKDLPNLKKMNLFGSKNLTTTPDFSGIPKLQVLDFLLCKNLVEIHPSIADLKCLKRLNLGFCSKLKKIPEFSGPMKNVLSLSLYKMSIEKLSSSIGCLVGLTSLLLMSCKNLTGLPNEICNLKSLKGLNVDGCSKIDELPENMGEMESLTELQLCETSIRQLPRSVYGLKKLYCLSLRGSGSQPNKSRFWQGLPRLYHRNAIVLGSLDGLCSLGKLDLSGCGLCEGDLPNDIGCLSYLEELKLSGNNFVSLPASIGCLSKLKLFWVSGCQKLQQLPDLSKLISLVDIDITGCTSLKMLPHLSSNCSLVDINNEMHFRSFRCANCFVLVDNEGCDSILLKMLQRYLQVLSLSLSLSLSFVVCYNNNYNLLTSYSTL